MFEVSGLLDVNTKMRLRRIPLLHRALQGLKRIRQAVREGVYALLRRRPVENIFAPARGFFSEIALLREGKIEGRIVLEDQGSPKLHEPSIILLCRRTQHLQQPWPIFWSHHRNARLIGPSLVHLNAERALSLEAAYGERPSRADPAWYFTPREQPLHLKGCWTSLLGQWLRNDDKNWYAHWLLDALPRLALLKEFPPETRILVPPRQLRYQVESLQLLGLWDRCRPTAEQHLLIDDYYFSSPPSMIVCYSPYAVQYLRTAFLPKAANAPATPKRFFVRRTSVGRNMINEAEVLSYFQEIGWTVVDTAALSFLEQIHWFAGAEAVAAIHGSGTSNMVWCSAGCKFVELFAADYLAGDQEWIAQSVGVEYHFMIFPSDYKLDAAIDLSRVREKLREIGLLP